ncbi:hypothetical protein FPE01S_03_03460 [Flavihumibacter petaseus NBRC 106054]|uniref:DUF4397 domain-containing protein n=2 Tax=Flavihumibacter TaxID=1004301 RepID=A0A0E9N3D2_9BACT|nr:hypothetical protein FPE01S_03_03460 [Flavihumibacter petaseus NBRC 106054]
MRNFSFALVFALVFMAACQKDETTEGPKARIALINAALDSEPISLLLDDQPLNEVPVSFGEASGTAENAYLPTGPGVRTTTWKVGESIVADNKFLAWSPGKYYTMIHYDTAVNGVAPILILNDDPQPNDSVGKGRFINCVAGSDSLTLWLIRPLNATRNDTTRVASKQVWLGFSNTSNNINGAYNATIQPKEYWLQLLSRDSTILFRDTLTFQSKQMYTFVGIGETGGTGAKSPQVKLVLQPK